LKEIDRKIDETKKVKDKKAQSKDGAS